MAWFLCAYLCMGLCIVTAFAQSGGTITGTVSDTDGVALAKAAIQAKNASSGAVYKAESSTTGAYTLAQLPVGTYDLSVFVPGMRPYRQNVTVQAAQTLRLDIRVQDFENLNTLGDGRELFADLTTPHKTPAGPTPRAARGKPDLSGVWYAQRTIDPGKPEPLPWAQALAKERTENSRKDHPMAYCLPGGITFFAAVRFYRVVQTPAILVVISEAGPPGYRQIFLDGRSHPKNLEPAWMGHSIGQWEGDTLVVDSVGFNDKTWLDNEGRPHTEKLHLTERYRRPNLGHLEVEFTIDDPGPMRSLGRSRESPTSLRRKRRFRNTSATRTTRISNTW
jgi:hypothetical protein